MLLHWLMISCFVTMMSIWFVHQRNTINWIFPASSPIFGVSCPLNCQQVAVLALRRQVDVIWDGITAVHIELVTAIRYAMQS